MTLWFLVAGKQFLTQVFEVACLYKLSRCSVVVVMSVTVDTYTAATVTASARSLLSGQASSPLLGVRVDCVVPGRSISGPEDWGPAGAGGVWASGDVVGRAASGVCCRSAEEVAGLGGLGEDEESAGGAELC